MCLSHVQGLKAHPPSAFRGCHGKDTSATYSFPFLEVKAHPLRSFLIGSPPFATYCVASRRALTMRTSGGVRVWFRVQFQAVRVPIFGGFPLRNPTNNATTSPVLPTALNFRAIKIRPI